MNAPHETPVSDPGAKPTFPYVRGGDALRATDQTAFDLRLMRRVAGENDTVRLSAKSDYALRAMAELGAHPVEHALKAEDIAVAQDIPLRFLLGILNELRVARLVTSQRGIQGGYSLARPASEIYLADVIRAIDGPLVSVHGESVSTMQYAGPAVGLRDIWMAVRASLRSVLELVSIADLVNGDLPANVRQRVAEYQSAEADRGRALDHETADRTGRRAP